MKPIDEHPSLRGMVSTLRIIVIVLTLGVAGFLGYTVYVIHGPKPPTDLQDEGILTYVLLGLVAAVLVAYFIVRSVLLRKARELYSRKDIDGFRGGYQSATIVSAAMIEGPGFFAAVVHLLTGSSTALAIGAACVVAMVLLIPSESSVNEFLEDAP